MTLAAAFGLMPFQNTFVFAAEGGVGHYVPGAFADFGDLAPPESGWAVLDWYNHYNGSAGANKTIPVSGHITANLHSTSNAEMLGAQYTFPCSILNGKYSAAVIAPYIWVNTTGAVTGPFGRLTRADSTSGIGDITMIPFWLHWASGEFSWGVQLDVYAPTGDYNTGQLANAGLNFWTFEPLVSVSYISKKIGLEVTTTAGLDFNTNNNATDYQSGDVFHFDTTIAEHLPFFGCGTIGAGINGYYWKQFTGDSGSGAKLGSFETLMTGVGPVLSYISPQFCGHTIVAELKWLPQMDTHYTLNGDYIWFKVALLF
jgi:hypothetical protein